MLDHPHPTRRDFAAGLAALTSLAGTTHADEPPAKSVPDALLEVARLRFEKILSEEQLKSLKQSLARQQLSAQLLRKIKLSNGDDPSAAFRADLP